VLIVLGSCAHIRTPPCSPPPFSTTHASFPPPPHHLPPSRSFSNLTAASAARVSCSRAAPLLHTILAAPHPVPFLSPHTQATPFRTPYKFHPPCFPHTHSCSPCCCAPPTSCTFLPPACFLRLRRYPPHTPLPFPVLSGGHTAEMLCVVGALDHTHTCSPSLLLPQLLPSAPRPCLSSAPSGGHTAEMLCLRPTQRRCWGHTAEMLCLVGALDHGRYSPRCYIAAATDAISLPKARQLEQALAQQEAPAPALPVPPPSYLSVYRSREVGQSYLTSVLTTIAATLHAMLLVARVRPQLVHVRCMGGAWEVHGRCMGGAWEVHGRCMGGAWEVHGRCMGGAWEVHGTTSTLVPPPFLHPQPPSSSPYIGCPLLFPTSHTFPDSNLTPVSFPLRSLHSQSQNTGKQSKGVRLMRLIRTQFRNPLPSWWQVLGVQSSSIVFVESVARVAVLGVQSSSIVFVESVARVDHLSLTGRLLHRLGIVDRFFVQWPHLTSSCKGTHYLLPRAPLPCALLPRAPLPRAPLPHALLLRASLPRALLPRALLPCAPRCPAHRCPASCCPAPAALRAAAPRPAAPCAAAPRAAAPCVAAPRPAAPRAAAPRAPLPCAAAARALLPPVRRTAAAAALAPLPPARRPNPTLALTKVYTT
ncbi:unnamed protein product, partial [Closterium sp. Naga37s-1]